MWWCMCVVVYVCVVGRVRGMAKRWKYVCVCVCVWCGERGEDVAVYVK